MDKYDGRNGGFDDRKRPARSTAASMKKIRTLLDYGNWELWLRIDARELNGPNNRDRKRLETVLERANIPFTIEECLPVGDMCWEVRRQNEAYLLNLLIERKRVTDLVRSIKERVEGATYKPLTRVELQMYKMQHSGIDNKIYLVEGVVNELDDESDQKRARTYMDILERDHEDFTVERKNDLNETIQFIVNKHNELKAHATEFLQLNDGDYLTLRALKSRVDTALKCKTFRWKLQLRQLGIKIGEEKAKAIAGEFPDEAALRSAIHINEEETRERLASLRTSGGRRVGPTAATNLCMKFIGGKVTRQPSDNSVASLPPVVSPDSQLGDNTLIHNEDDASLHAALRASLGMHKVKESNRQLPASSFLWDEDDETFQAAARASLETHTSEELQRKLPASPRAPPARDMFNRLQKYSREGTTLVSREIENVDSGVMEKSSIVKDPNAARRLHWIKENEELAVDLIRQSIDIESNITVEQTASSIDQFLTDQGVPHPKS